MSFSAPSGPNAHKYKFTSRCLFETPIVGAPGRGLCAFQTRPRMANHDISWVPGTHVHFGNLNFIIMVGGELVRAHAAIRSLPSIDLDDKRLGRQLDASLGLQQSREDQRRLALPTTNDMAWPSREGLLSLERHVWSAPIAFPFGLRNAAATVGHLVALHMV